MAEHENGMPRPEAHWIALGVVVAALAETIGPKRRKRFFAALRAISEQHESRSRVVVFGHSLNGRRNLPQCVRVAVRWIRGLIDELDDGAGR